MPGVTTIIGRFKDSGGLLWWAFEQGQKFERGEISGLYEKRDQAAEAGTLCHDMVEAHIRKWEMPDLEKYDPELVLLAQQGFENYIRWEKTTNIEVVETEKSLVSERYGFGGTLDAIMASGQLALGDWKTSSSGPFIDWLLQLAAYAILWEENHPNRPINGGFYLCRFSKNNGDFFHYHWSELETAKKMFLLFLEAYELAKQLKKRL
ncbi:MAG: PD-(D/E)XK nuclease family protein [Deltaproteobacteria bacterium]|nr:PD-(D/E)XK nuclease family protein [Deltaproteobacteria bacterium]